MTSIYKSGDIDGRSRAQKNADGEGPFSHRATFSPAPSGPKLVNRKPKVAIDPEWCPSQKRTDVKFRF